MGRRGPAGARQAALSRGWETDGRVSSAGMPRRAERALRGAAGAGSAQARVPTLPGSCKCGVRAPRSSARDRPAPHLSRALPEWLYGIAS